MKRYFHLLSPVMAGRVLLKNRMIASNSMPHFLQGEQPGPAQSMIDHLSRRAANGAAAVTLSNTFAPMGPKTMPAPPEIKDIPHMPVYDIYNKQAQNRSIMLADAIHFYGSKACLNLMRPHMPGYAMQDNPERRQKAYPAEMIYQVIDSYIEQAKVGKEMGYDIGSIHCAYNSPLSGQMLSAVDNQRTDEFGGSFENRIRFLYLICKGIKEACGPNFAVEVLVSSEDAHGGYTVEDLGRYLKYIEPYVDMVQVRMPDADSSHPTGFTPEHVPALKYTAYLKTLGLDMLIGAVGGFQNAEEADAAIAEGKCDLVYAARAFICDFDYEKKLEEGRGQDVTPCIRCNKCHVIANDAVMVTGCSVNPKFGLEHMLERMVRPAERVKKVAVVGGGPAGMEAALTAAQRGHEVTLYEASPQLGGALIAAGTPEFKWPVRDFTAWMVRQVEQSNITVRLNTKAAPAALASEGYDHVIAALDGMPLVPDIPGVERVITGPEAFLHPEQVTGSAVVIGGGEIGVEAGIYLARRGHKVTVLEMTGQFAREANRPHYYATLLNAVQAEQNLTILVNAKVTAITADAVEYTDQDGATQSVPAQSVILSAGTRGKTKEALAFYAAGDMLSVIGDCQRPASLMEAMRAGFAAASQI